MKQVISVLIILLFVTSFASAQFGLGERLKRKVEEKIGEKSEEAIEKAMEEPKDETEDEAKTDNDKTEATKSAKLNEQSLTSYSKFDFIPGERIIFFDDFSQDNVGDFPAKWNTNGSGEVTTNNLFPGKWLKLASDANYVPDIKYPFPENFTVEFDLIGSFDMEYEDQFFGYIRTDIIRVDEIANSINSGYETHLARNEFEMKYSNVATAWVKGFNANGTDISNSVVGKWLQTFHKKIVHVSIAINKQRYRMWINQSKVFDVPRLAANDAQYNALRFAGYSINTDKDYNVLISNIKFAEGSIDTRSKLITEGKLVTNGITFDTGSDKIKPESFQVIKSIADALTSNPQVNILIIGHTDSDGNPSKNLTLSQSRAISVKNALVKEFSISESRIQTDGKGDTMPVAENTSATGKASNRRVEFVKK